MIARTLIAPLAALSTLALGSALTPVVAHAAPNGGTVKGTISLGSANRTHPIGSQGFVKRKPNPIKELKKHDPRQNAVVVLVDGKVAEEDKAAPRHGASWKLIGESFEFPVMPIQAGTAIDIKNTGRNKPQLYSPDDPDLVDEEPISPGGVRSVRLAATHKAMRIRDRDSAHLEGLIVAFPHPYFSRVDASGNYQINGVPPGRWTVRIWYRDGWLKATKKVDVPAKRPVKVDTISLPHPISPKVPGAAATAEKKGS